jgi:alpha-L-arabinofuranosidase
MSIPEFVLRKLVLPGSLKRTPSGFSFVLHNTFAPATITRFQVLNDGEELPLSQITITEEGKPSMSAELCSSENPLLTPVNVNIGISIISMKPLGLVTIKAATKEVGPIEFTIEQQKKRKTRGSLPDTGTSIFRPTLKAKVELDLNSARSEISPFLLGQFVEHLERCVYDGIWTKDGSSIRSDTLDLIKQLNPSMIRYPGGNFASGYHWEDGIGPKENRPHRHDAAWQAEESNQVGTDEFLSFCENIGTEPCIVVNDGSGTPEEAARWVAYCNSSLDSLPGKRRAANGHPEPYHVKYWGIGNEVWGAWRIGTTTAYEYVKRLKRFISAMKEVDPSIKIIAVGNHPLTDNPQDPAAIWNQVLLENASDQFDFLSWHIYQPEKEGWQEDPDEFELFKSITAAPLDIDTFIQRIDQQIHQSGNAGKVFQALDEWNVWLPPKKGETSMHHVTYTMRDALYVASTLAVLFRNSAKVKIANLAQLVNVLPLIQTNNEAAIATSLFYPFILFSQMLEIPLECSINSSKFSNKAMGPNISAHENVNYLDCLATQDPALNKIKVILINRDPMRKMLVNISDFDSVPYTITAITAVKTSNPLAANDFINADRIKMEAIKLSNSHKLTGQVKMEPASIYLVEYQINKNA